MFDRNGNTIAPYEKPRILQSVYRRYNGEEVSSIFDWSFVYFNESVHPNNSYNAIHVLLKFLNGDASCLYYLIKLQ